MDARWRINSAFLTMKIKAIIFLFSAFLSLQAAAYSKDYSKIDAYAKAIPNIKTESVEALAKYLVIPAKGDSEKVRSIFTWITSHINYDWAAFENNTAQWQEPLVTIKSRKGVCQNFSDLFTALCAAAKLEAQTITGYAKTDINTDWMLNGFASSNHAWNVVKVSGKWQLMEVTWAQNTGSMTYFMADPHKFRSNHLPAEPQWQLTKDTMTLEEYEHMPILKEGYDAFHITHLTPVESCLRGKKKIIFNFDSPRNMKLIAEVSNYDYSNHSTPKFIPDVIHTGNHYTLTLTFAAEGIYWVTLEANDFFGDIATYIVDTSKM